MRPVILRFAGVALAFAAVAAANDNDLYHRAKLGRVEAVQPAAVAQACCRRAHAPQALTAIDQRFRAKLGRNTPAADARFNAAKQDTANHIRKCVSMGQCSLMAVATSKPAATPDARLQEKYGRTTVEPVASLDSPACEHACCAHGQ